MKLQGLTLGRGVLRVYLVLWLLWALVIAFSSHKALLTAVGVTYWTPESVMERNRLEFDTLGCTDPIRSKSEECVSFSPQGDYLTNDVVTKDDVDHALTAFLLGVVVLPIAILTVGVLLWFLTKWVVRGFLSNHEK